MPEQPCAFHPDRMTGVTCSRDVLGMLKIHFGVSRPTLFLSICASALYRLPVVAPL